MSNVRDILWVGPVFSDQLLSSYRAVSPAANRWQIGLIRGLKNAGVDVRVAAHLPEPVWPKGKLWVNNTAGDLPKDISGTVIGYFNLPVLRHWHLGRGFLKSLEQMARAGTADPVVMTYNTPPGATYAARHIRQMLQVPWVCIVADGEAPEDADGYVFLSWGYFQSFQTRKPRLHLDGGTFWRQAEHGGWVSRSVEPKPKVIMYTGTFSKFGGAAELIRAFSLLKVNNVELWLTSKGASAEILAMAARNKRIKLFGFVSQAALEELVGQSDVLVNPRPSNIIENRWNFPSKVLEYLSFGKPVVSTWTEGLGADYRDVLVVVKQDNEMGLAEALKEVLEWSPEQNEMYFKRAAKFCESHTWEVQAKRCLDWITEVKL